MTVRASHQGISSSEYAILLGLVAIVAIAGLSASGNSISGLLGGQNRHLASGGANSANSLVNLSFQGTASASSSSKGGANGGRTGSMDLIHGSSAPGVNVSSADGSRLGTGFQPFDGSMGFAMRMDALASKTQNPDLQAWYRETSKKAYFLAGSEAIYESQTGSTNPAILKMASAIELELKKKQTGSEIAYNSIALYLTELTQRRQDLLTNPKFTGENKETALAMLDQMIQTTQQQYNVDLSDSEKFKKDEVLEEPTPTQFENLKAMANAALGANALSTEPAIESSASTGASMAVPSP